MARRDEERCLLRPEVSAYLVGEPDHGLDPLPSLHVPQTLVVRALDRVLDIRVKLVNAVGYGQKLDEHPMACCLFALPASIRVPL